MLTITVLQLTESNLSYPSSYAGAIRIRTLIMDPMFKELDFLRKSEGMLRTQRCAQPVVRELRTDTDFHII